MSMAPTDVEMVFVGENEWFQSDPEKMAEQVQEKTTELAVGINARELAFYNEKELQTGQKWFPTSATQIPYRYGFRMIVHWDKALPNGTVAVPATLTQAHLIPQGATITWFTNLTGVAVNGTPEWRALAGSDLTISADATNVILTATADLRAYTGAYIVMEYLKQD